MAREAITFFFSYWQALQELPEESKNRLTAIILNYAFSGELPEGLTGIEKAIFLLVKPNIDNSNQSRDSGRNGGRPKKENPLFETEKPPFSKTENPPFENSKSNRDRDKDKDKDKNRDMDREREEEKTGAELLPATVPTPEQIKAYCQNEKLTTMTEQQQQKFYLYYQSKGWDTVKDWRARLKKWDIDNKEREKQSKAKTNGFTNYPQRELNEDYFKELEQKKLTESLKKGGG